MAKQKRTALQSFDDTEKCLMETGLNDKKVSKGVEAGMEMKYTGMLVLWDE